MQSIVELPEFVRKARPVLKDHEKTELINFLAEHPLSGDLIQGTGASEN